MVHGTTKKVAFIASYLPRKCGIATFTSDLVTSLKQRAGSSISPLIVAMRSGNDEKYHNPVKFEIRQQVKNDYISAADYLNFSHIDAICLQHEFGLFGGEAGSYLQFLLRRLKAPVVTVLHTVLQNPEESYYKSMLDVCQYSSKLVTMNERGITMLQNIYGVHTDKIQLIPHGIPDLPFVDSNYYKHKFGLEGRRTILTFGLLSKNKGIETLLKAMPAIVAADPSIVYIVLGMTHPNVLKHEGESYRFSLHQIVKDLNLENNVLFYNRFVNNEELHNFLCAADLYVTPYLNEAQLTSGTLSFAVGSGKAVISTPYWAAEELLSGGRGRIVPFDDSKAMAEEIIKILQDDLVFYSMRRRAYDYGRSHTWPALGEVYWNLLNELEDTAQQKIEVAEIDQETNATIELPDPSLDHIIRMTDDTGLLQHASYTIPNRLHGYCTDDNARAVILLTRYYNEYPEPEALRLLDTYLSFTLHAQKPNGELHNFMNYNRTWVPNEVKNDAFGRFLWALGTIMAQAPNPAYISVVKEYFDRSVPLIQKQYPRGMAYSIIGMCDYLRQFPGASDIKHELEIAANGLVNQYEENRYPDWEWFEDALTYDNGVLPHALFEASITLNQARYQEVAQQTCDFLIHHTFTGEYFSLIGCNGWYERDQSRATFDQQPIDAASVVMMLRAAYNLTRETHYLVLQRKAFDWFLGANDGHLALYDFRTTGCYDGLTPNGVNLNQGAESTLSYLLSLLEVMDSYALLDKPSSKVPVSTPNIVEISGKSRIQQTNIDKVR